MKRTGVHGVPLLHGVFDIVHGYLAALSALTSPGFEPRVERDTLFTTTNVAGKLDPVTGKDLNTSVLLSDDAGEVTPTATSRPAATESTQLPPP